uniref:phenylalanine--tRNA ligase n=1 Tax=Sphondylothamnion multifidum TaxID=193186 RepID=A0A4D6WZM0_9FLOR|nr:Phenylalanine-tRNA ligase beta subunit [Sphondylothamnion multifidum]
MKFSWQALNYLIDLTNIPLEHLKSKLILNGFEIENIEINDKTQDCIIDIDITSNRIDTTTISGIAKEMSSIFNIPLNFPIINLNNYIYKNYSIKPLLHNNNKIISYIQLNKITNIENFEPPKWLKNYVDMYELPIVNNNLLNYIQYYIQLKWGNTIHYINDANNIKYRDIKITEDITKQKSSIEYGNKNILDISINSSNDIKIETKTTIILCFVIYNDKYVKHNYIYNLTHAYYETIKLLTTYSRCTIGKTYIRNYNLKNKVSKITISKKYIVNILGPTKNHLHKLLTKQQILIILKQLQLKPEYIKNKFYTTIPEHRKQDLTRDIDIIEEIARIYGFGFFIDKIQNKNKKGKITKQRFVISKIKTILQNLGFNEAINSSFIYNNTYNKKIPKNLIYLCNPMTEEQKIIRHTLLDNLISNYIYNLKQKNNIIEFFEIGKIFNRKDERINENLHISGIVFNENYIRYNWENKSEPINWFHVKGILETLLIKLNAKVLWSKISDYHNNDLNGIKYLLNTNKIIGIYNPLTQDLIGFLSQLNTSHYKHLQKYSIPCIFDININKLMDTIKNYKQLDYTIKPYSTYPSVIRDISIKFNHTYKINDIKNTILKNHDKLIESIKIINSYYDTILKSNYLCLRITYRSANKTLDSTDIKNIDNNIKIIIQNFL